MPRRALLAIVVFAGLAAVALAMRLLVGVGGHDWGWPRGENAALVAELRLLRAAGGLVVGVSLAVSGVMLQSLLRNPLASPDLLGLSASASLFVVLGLVVGSGQAHALAWPWQAGPAALGSLAALALVYALSQRGGAVHPASLVLIGVMLSIIAGAAIGLVQHLFPGRDVGGARLLVGSLSDDLSWSLLVPAGVITLVASLLAGLAGPGMDAASLGDDEAGSVGANVPGLRLLLVALSGVLAAVAVTLAGPVGFVGLICPHMARLATGMHGGHGALVVAAGLAGAGVTVGADTIVRAVRVPSGTLPLGIVMALVGGPVFIVMLRRELARGEAGL
ncbi:MAG TPA: iron ABC transporter permease [Phycisphaerales bacterium]|nr:iron ABC transporter permease [Phycisphaerales bacterium]